MKGLHHVFGHGLRGREGDRFIGFLRHMVWEKVGVALRIRVVVKTRARENRVERVGEDEYLVLIKEAPKRGRANVVLLKVLSQHFGGQARILSGFTSRKKVIEIDT